MRIISGQRKLASRNASSMMCFCPWFNMYNLPSAKGSQRARHDLGTMDNGQSLPSIIVLEEENHTMCARYRKTRSKRIWPMQFLAGSIMVDPGARWLNAIWLLRPVIGKWAHNAYTSPIWVGRPETFTDFARAEEGTILFPLVPCRKSLPSPESSAPI